MDIIRIHRLELDCIVGIRPPERVHQQRIRLDLAMHADVSQAGRTGRISMTADYDQAAHEVAALLSFRRYHLIEMAAEEVAAMLLGIHVGVQRVDVRIEKPGALAGRARAASVEVKRRRSDFPRSIERSPEGEQQVLLDTRESRLELLRIEPGQHALQSQVVQAQAGQAEARRSEARNSEASHAEDAPAESLCWLLSGSAVSEHGPLSIHLPEGAIRASADSPNRLQCPGPDPALLFRCWRRTPRDH
jgi:FolB domain-containing protein